MEYKDTLSRIKKIFSYAPDVDVILLMNTDSQDPNFFYLTGLTSGLYEYSYLILEKKKATLFTSSLEYETARENLPKEFEVVLMDSKSKFRTKLTSMLKNKTIGINEFFLPVGLYNLIKKRYYFKATKDISLACSKSRLIKDSLEIEKIKKAVSITKWAMVLITKEFKLGMTEMELAAKFDNISASLGSSKPSFTTIVCFGKNAALPHHMPDNTKLVEGDIILIDAGAKVDGYCSDMTRTFIFGNDKSKNYTANEKIIKAVKSAQLKAIHAIKPGVKGSSIHKIAADYINAAENGKYKDTFIHALGHSLGIEVHDGIGFSPGANQILKPGMVITVEPGIYLPGFGGARIEDDILVTKDGVSVL
ncbi:MAG: M24 family metallopeptidase [Candidatus Micrarchaeia archaeon]